jgi:hypothetical protein
LSTTPAGRSTGVSTYSRRERRWQWWVKERIVSSKESRGVWAQWGWCTLRGDRLRISRSMLTWHIFKRTKGKGVRAWVSRSMLRSQV